MLTRLVTILVLLVVVSVDSYTIDEISQISNLAINFKHYEAIDRLEKLISKYPNNIVYYSFLIHLCLDIGENELAEKYVKKALNYEKNDININSYYMEVERLKGNIQKSMEISDSIMKIPEARTNLIFVIMRSRLLRTIQPSEAERFLKPYTKIFSNYNIFLEMAEIQLALGKLDQVKENLDKAILFERLDKRIYSLYGEYYYRIGMFNEAIRNLEKSIIFPGNSVREYYLLGSAYFRMGNYQKSLEYLRNTSVPKETLANIMYLSGDYSKIIKTFKEPETEVLRYFVEESQIRLSPQKITKDRERLSDERLKIALEIKNRALPYYNIHLARSIRLNPLNFSAWFEIGNYYRFYHSPYTALEELSIAKNLFLNDVRMQDFYENLESYVSNSSRLSGWGISTVNTRPIKFLVQVDKVDYDIDKMFYHEAIVSSIENIKIRNINISIVTNRKSVTSLRNYDLVINVRPEVLKDYLKLSVDLIDPVNYEVITSFSTYQRYNSEFISTIYQNFRSALLSHMPIFGEIVGVKGNNIVVRFLSGVPSINDSVNITTNNLASLFKTNYTVIARATVTDGEGEYRLAVLDPQFRYITQVKPGFLVVKP